MTDTDSQPDNEDNTRLSRDLQDDDVMPFIADANRTDEGYDIRIDKDGIWYHNGGRINRQPLVKLFSTVLKRDEAGDYWLVTPAEQGRILVEDVPFVAVEVQKTDAENRQVLSFRTNIDEVIEAGPKNPIRVETDSETGEPRPYIRVRDRLEARILRSVYYHLMDLAIERQADDGSTEVGVESKGTFFMLGSY